ncbi:polyprenyl synthetase family protein [Streptococcus hongkongensis]|nr:geranyl transferase [Streptococcus uberis]
MDKLREINQTINQFYHHYQSVSEDLIEAIMYSVDSGGKRIRPLFLLEVLEALQQEINQNHLKVASALEMVHTGSLIHDDLPAMDDDDYRRGRLTNHKQFDEATAILAGDSLFIDPFLLISETTFDAQVKVTLISQLALAAGTFGMVGGQMLDMKAEGLDLNLSELQEIHNHKTGKLLAYPFTAAAIIAKLPDTIVTDLTKAGELIGHAFQVRDDILDITAKFEELGKTPNKDIKANKSTYPGLVGLEKSYHILNADLNDALLIFEKLASQINFQPENLIALVERLRLDA